MLLSTKCRLLPSPVLGRLLLSLTVSLTELQPDDLRADFMDLTAVCVLQFVSVVLSRWLQGFFSLISQKSVKNNLSGFS